jgi:hypothetical protein
MKEMPLGEFTGETQFAHLWAAHGSEATAQARTL